jgi:hypothetical protein
LSYIKKLCLHPYLLATASKEKKRQIGLLVLTEEEEMLERLQKEEQDKLQSTVRVTTRRSM